MKAVAQGRCQTKFQTLSSIGKEVIAGLKRCCTHYCTTAPTALDTALRKLKEDRKWIVRPCNRVSKPRETLFHFITKSLTLPVRPVEDDLGGVVQAGQGAERRRRGHGAVHVGQRAGPGPGF